MEFHIWRLKSSIDEAVTKFGDSLGVVIAVEVKMVRSDCGKYSTLEVLVGDIDGNTRRTSVDIYPEYGELLDVTVDPCGNFGVPIYIKEIKND